MAGGRRGFSEVESMQLLTETFGKYMEELDYSYKYLTEMSEVCRAAMSGDRPGQMQAEQLMFALERLHRKKAEAESLMADMDRELKKWKDAQELMHTIKI